MLKRMAALMAVVALAGFPLVATAGGGSGGGGGGSRVTTVKFTGIIVDMQDAPEGVYVTVGTSYYTTGTALVTPDTSIKLNGSSYATIDDLQLGDTATIVANWPSLVATKIEAIRY
jgi:hypothetical protein